MKCTGLSESQRLEILLENALLIEASKWKVPCFLVSTIKGTDISPMQYEQTVLWMKELKLRFNFYPETFGLAVSILNRILASVKVQVKYLQCIAVTCLYLAAKTNEEDEIIPSVKKLAMQSGCLYSSAEILRMERIILDKLQWDLYTSTPVDFLNTFHAMVMSNWPHLFGGLSQMNPSLHVALLTRQLQHCMACHQLLQFRGSTVALAIMTLELERMAADWFPVMTELLKKTKVDHVELIHCKELVDRCLGTETNPVYIFISANKDIKTRIRDHVSYCLPSVTCSTLKRNKTVHKATFEMETDEFYDGFQLLYNEDRGEMNDTLMSKKSQIVTEESGLCPPLTVPISELVSSL
ncbi:cyclin-I2 isoform X1 [Dendropsophus ebraccatus]|uniref:cyclin-I2 isoform X1 n=1 Tax=Dendropsophus ebraccatus TaxID=150705 RepID=UPI0038320715